MHMILYTKTLNIDSDFDLKERLTMKCKNSIIVAVGGLVLILLVQAVPAQDRESDTPLRLDLKLAQRQLCIGKPLVAQFFLKNISKHDIIIDAKQIGYTSSFVSVNSTKRGINGEAINIIGDNFNKYQSKFVVINPGKAYSESFSFVPDSDSFRAGRNYTMQISYGQFKPQTYLGQKVWVGNVNSNEVEFKIKSCQ